jgi:hypothetical protein
MPCTKISLQHAPTIKQAHICMYLLHSLPYSSMLILQISLAQPALSISHMSVCVRVLNPKPVV